jgi:NADH-quinone oxidoreductase subunit C
MQSTAIIEALARAIPADPGQFEAIESRDGMPTIVVPRELLPEASLALRDEPALRFALLADIVAVDFYPREPRYELLYLLVSLGTAGFGETPKRLRMKVRVPNDDAVVPTVSNVWAAANWAERETYDLYGVRFEGHPDLRRILMPDDWEGHPMRKDYPVQIKAPVKTYAPLQLSEEEFVANVEAARSRVRED